MKPRILVVDDETVIAENLRLTLEREGHDVETAANTVGAMLRMETREFALAIVDLILPDGDGLHLLRLLKAKDPSIEVIIMRSEEHTSELQSRRDLVCRLLLEKKKIKYKNHITID